MIVLACLWNPDNFKVFLQQLFREYPNMHDPSSPIVFFSADHAFIPSVLGFKRGILNV